MLIPVILFYLFSAVAILSGLMVITARNPVHSVLFLILAFFNVAGLFVLLGAEYLAMTLVIVYVGAVAVLFLFVVMMLDINVERVRKGLFNHLLLSSLVAVVLFAELFFVLYSSTLSFDVRTTGIAPLHAPTASITNTEALGNILYTDFMLPFQVAGLVLLVAMMGAIVLTHRQRPGVRKQSIGEQVARDPGKTVELVKVKVGSGV